ncbi:hypothetical protein PF002_g21772 [Phytophthora fragariae]|uniref:Uncharacterized protein n=1 Tax=Phytophthora fragariae TaxID=53985 RepID=A0A6A3XEJ3_9STRA|nr:hypothetical protein PF002_g21772 [Phytophthora fragariae]
MYSSTSHAPVDEFLFIRGAPSCSLPEGCSCSLQARLHQVENARSREMKAHGELVQTLERELESRRTSEAELRLAAAKLRTDNCRLEAKLCVANAKARQLLEQLDNQRADNVRHIDEFKATNEENERRLQAARDKGDRLLDEKRQLSIELSESQQLLECSRHDGKLLQTKIEEQCVQISSQTEEIAKLLALASTKQQEIDASTARSQILLEDLSSARQKRSGMQEQLDYLERSLTRTVVTRNRALQWRRKRKEIWDDRFISHGTFLAWKSLAVQFKLDSVTNMAHCHERKRAQLKLFQDEITALVHVLT